MMQLSTVGKVILRGLLILLCVSTVCLGTFIQAADAANGSKPDTAVDCKWTILSKCGVDSGDRTGVDISRRGRSDTSAEKFRGKNLNGTDFTSAKMARANLNQVDLSGADLNQANLADVKLGRADLSRADFSNINWSQVNLSHDDVLAIVAANLNANGLFARNTVSKEDLLQLMEPDLRRLSFVGDDLSEADLSGASLRKANLSGVDLTKATLTGAKMPDGRTYK